MKRRIAGAALFGFGCLCLLVAAALVWVIVPTQRMVPYGVQPPDVVVEAPNATFVEAGTLPGGGPRLAVQQAGLRSRTGIQPDAAAAAALTGDLQEKALIWNVYQATDRADTGAPVNRAESRIALDRVSGAALPWSGQCYTDVPPDPSRNVGCVPGNIAFAGQLYLFPFSTQKQTYQYYDFTLRQALPIEYRGEGTYNGLPAYRFEQVIPRQQVATDAETLDGMLGLLAPGATTGTVYYQASRTLWVEPLTGAIVGYGDQQRRELVPDVGSPVPLIDATFRYDQATLETVGDEASHGRFLLLLLGRYLPIGLALAGLVAVVLGLLVSRRRAAARGAHAADDAPEREPIAAPRA
ncbi:DUF3068 domain-containing protein [Actinoplanes sp. NPDC049118]|uniref:DUF3068 domain-containing protein n=1 Tax=Actinoplanes sp. NPDC049118 TaxID=3155769 RepID=UPI0033DAFFF0